MKKCIILLLVIISLPTVFFSQEKEETPIFSGDEVVITATRIEMPQKSIGRSISVVTFSDIEYQKKLSIADILRDIPSIDITQNGGTGQFGSVFIRGAKSEHTLVMVDGIEMNDPISSGRSYDFAHLIPNCIEKIEIIKGPQSTLYGSDAIGGVINIITKKGIEKPSVVISGEAGSFGTYRESIQTSGLLENFNYTLSLSRLDIRGFSAAGEKYGNNEKDGYVNTNLLGRTGIKLSHNVSFDFVFHYLSTKTDLDNMGGVFGDDHNYIRKGKQFYFKNQFTIDKFNKKWTQVYSFSFMNNERDYLNERDTNNPDEFLDSNYNGKLYKFDFQNNIFANEMNTLAFGLEFEKEKGDSRCYSESKWGNFDTIFPNKETNIFGIYLHDNMNVDNTFLPTLGIRCDKHNIYGSSTTFHVAPVFLINKSNTKFRASLATGFKAPSLYQLYSQYGDKNLKAEKVKSFDFGLEQYLYKGILYFSTTYFYNDFSNMIDFKSNLYQYVNVGSAFTSGVEIETVIRALRKLNLKIFYAYLKTEDKTTKEELLRRAKNKGGVTVNYTGIDKFNFNVNVLVVGRRYDLDFSTFPAKWKILDKYIKVNLTASYDIAKNMQFFSRIENLTDQEYEDVLGYGTPRRSIYFGFKFVY